MEQIETGLQDPAVQKQLELLRMRSTHPAFGFDSNLEIGGEGSELQLKWTNGSHWAKLTADLKQCTYSVEVSE